MGGAPPLRAMPKVPFSPLKDLSTDNLDPPPLFIGEAPLDPLLFCPLQKSVYERFFDPVFVDRHRRRLAERSVFV